jgi:hypothetical protein
VFKLLCNFSYVNFDRPVGDVQLFQALLIRADRGRLSTAPFHSEVQFVLSALHTLCTK